MGEKRKKKERKITVVSQVESNQLLRLTSPPQTRHHMHTYKSQFSPLLPHIPTLPVTYPPTNIHTHAHMHTHARAHAHVHTNKADRTIQLF